jgi:hypothetical protein
MTRIDMGRGAWALVVAALVAAAPASALVRLGAGATGGFAFPSAAFDHDAKSNVGAGVRVYGNAFYWLTLDAAADFYLPFNAESDSGVGETRLTTYRAGFIYKVHMGVFMPFVAVSYAHFDQRIRREDYWEDVAAPGFYVAPGLEYFFTERFSAWGALAYERAFDDARKDDRDTQFVKLDFGVNYSFW